MWLTTQTREIKNYDLRCVDEVEFSQVSSELSKTIKNRKENKISDENFFKAFGENSPTTEELQPKETSGPLGEVHDIKTRSNSVEGRGRSLMMSMALEQDHIYLQKKIKETIREEISHQDVKNLKFIDDSLQLDGDQLKFKVVKNNDPNTLTELSSTIEHEKFKSKEMLDNMNDELVKMEPNIETGGKINDAHEVINVYLTISGLGGAIAEFEDGDSVAGAVNLAQSLYGLGAISKLNSRISRIAGKALSKVLSKSFSNIEAVVSKVASEDVIKVLDEGIGSFISVGFAVYNIVEDINKRSTIGYIDAGLDAAITITDTLGPEAEPLSMALLIVRLGIDDFYNEISMELKSLPSDASVGKKIEAVFKGIGEASFDIWEQFTLPGMIFGAITNSHKIDKEHDKDVDYVHKLSNYANYFKIEKEKNGGPELINFADGSTSWKGGSIDFILLEDGMAKLTLEEIPDTSGRQRSLTKTFTLNSDVQDIVVGIGEASSLSWKKITIKFLWFIPVHSKTVISGHRDERSSLHGTYHGNSKNNKFFTVQKLDESIISKLGYSLGDYFYQLYGHGGNDTFFLGPQKSHIEGGEGADAYIVPDYGGLTEINNYARDNIDDFLSIDVEFSRIWATREGQNLVLAHTTDHTITLKNWFSDVAYRHLRFRAKIGVIFEVATTALGQPDLRAVAIDHSNAPQKDNHVIDTSSSVIWSHVYVITGSSFSDTLIGNTLGNHLAGGRGNNYLVGGPGADKYSINKEDGCNTIDNYATDDVVDLLSLNFKFDEIEVKRTADESVQLHDKGETAICVKIVHWFVNASYQHLSCLSSDGVVFKISTNSSEQVILTPYLIDFEHMLGSQYMNLTAHAHYDSVLAVVGSSFDDVIIGNGKNNFLSGKQGNDRLEGGLGADVYILHKGDGHDVIVNVALDRKQDLLLFGCSYDNIIIAMEAKDLLIQACAQPPKTNASRCGERSLFSARLRGWFRNEFYQHLVVKSIDGVVFRLPLQQNHAIVKIPVVIDKSRSHTSVTIDATHDEWKTVQRIIGSTSTPNTLIGNQINNIIEAKGNWSHVEGGNGSDTYIIHSGNVVVDNFASDNKTDTVQLQDNYMNLAVQQHEDDLILVRSVQNSNDSHHAISISNQSVTVLGYKSNPQRQHLIGVTRDKISFRFSNNTYIPEAFLIDKHSMHDRVAINLGDNYTWANVIKVYGAAKGPNHLTANLNSVTLTGGGYPDLLEGNKQDDVIKGGEGDDLIDGQLGNDILVGGPGQDWILGGLGDDLIYPGEGPDRIDGGLGRDTVIFKGDTYNRTGVFADLLFGQGFGGDAMNDVYINIENLIGSQFNDILTGNSDNNVLKGRGGNDFLYPNDGNDMLFGDNGADVYVLDGASGLKMINNYAKDNMTDVLYIGDRRRESLRLMKKMNNLVMHTGKVYGSYWCPEDDTTSIQVIDWYKDKHYQHLSMFLSNTQLSSEKLQDVANSAPSSLELSGWDKFVCSVCKFGIGNAVGVAIAILCAIIMLLLLVWCVWKRRKIGYQNIDKIKT